MKSCIYRGTVSHDRRTPTPHAFRYRLFMMYLDLSELDEVFRGRWLWSTRRPAPVWFRRADYLGDPTIPLADAVRAEAERQTGSRPAGPIRMLTHLRTLGYIQNPVTFYYCFDEDGRTVRTILAEITNTPWGERHTYALTANDEATERTHSFDKAFHVSPFMDMDHEYRWRFSEPGSTLRVHMQNRVDDDRVFDAALTLDRVEITGRSLAAALLGHPLMTAQVALGIYWQALRLKLKGAPFFAHPAGRAA